MRIRDDAVEFTFTGEFPGKALQPSMLEYLVSGPEKSHETLLVAPPAELARLQMLKPVFDRRAAPGQGRTWSARLAWTDDGQPRSVELADLLQEVKNEDRSRFLDGIRVHGGGLGGDRNVAADPSILPKRPVPAVVYLTIRIADG